MIYEKILSINLVAILWLALSVESFATQETEPNGGYGDPLCYKIQPGENCPPDLVNDNSISGNVTAAVADISTYDKDDYFYFNTNHSTKMTLTLNQFNRSNDNECTRFFFTLYGKIYQEPPIKNFAMDIQVSTVTFLGPGKWDIRIMGDAQTNPPGCPTTNADYNMSWVLETLANDANEIEDNDTMVNACIAQQTNIGVIGCFRSTDSTYGLNRDNDDYYKFTATSNEVNVKFITDNYLMAYYPTNVWVAIKNDSGGEIVRGSFTQNFVETITTSALVPENEYYIQVHCALNTAGRYEVEVEQIAQEACPDCTGDNVVIKDFIIKDGSICNCTAQTVTIGPNVTLQNGSKFTVDADTLHIIPDVNVQEGAEFNTSP